MSLIQYLLCFVKIEDFLRSCLLWDQNSSRFLLPFLTRTGQTPIFSFSRSVPCYTKFWQMAVLTKCKIIDYCHSVLLEALWLSCKKKNNAIALCNMARSWLNVSWKSINSKAFGKCLFCLHTIRQLAILNWYESLRSVLSNY